MSYLVYTNDSEHADDGRPRYQHWSQQALREVRQVSIATWAEKVVDARCFYEPATVTTAQRTAWQKQAIAMALNGDERATVGGWPPTECIQKSRMTYEQMVADPSRPRDLDSVRQCLRELGNPTKQFYGRDMLARLGEAMLERMA